MPRAMSCALTIDAVRERRKTVTRRHVGTWVDLMPTDRLTLVEKAQGIPKGGHQVRLADVEVVSVRVEPLWCVDADEVALEGLTMRPADFVAFWAESHGHRGLSYDEQLEIRCRRIEWRYLEEPAG